MSDDNLAQTAKTTGIAVGEKYNNLFSEDDYSYRKCGYEKAKEYFQSLLNEPSISRVDLARCYSSLGAIGTKQHDYKEALNNYHKQLDVLRELTITDQTERDITKCYMSIGIVYWLKQDYVQALDYHNQALKALSTGTTTPDLTSKIYKNLANLYTKTNEFDLAIMYFEKALELDRRHLREDHLKFGQTYADIGAMFYSQQDYTRALDYFLKARETWFKSLLPSHIYIESMNKTIAIVQSKLEAERSRKSDVISIQKNTSTASLSNDRYTQHDIVTLINTIALRHQTSELSTFTSNTNMTSQHLQSTRSNNRDDKSYILPAKSPKTPVSKEKTPPKSPVRLKNIDSVHEWLSDSLQTQQPATVNDCSIFLESPDFTQLSTSRPRRLYENYASSNSDLWKTFHSGLDDRQEQLYSGSKWLVSKDADNNDNNNNIFRKFYNLFEAILMVWKIIWNNRQYVHDRFENELGDDTERKPPSFSQHSPVETFDEDSDSSSLLDKTKSLIVRIQSLCRYYRFEVSVDTTMKHLIDIIWREAEFDMERYREDSHILLLFNHRLHIFVAIGSNALVKDFLLLSPPPSSQQSINDSIDFYVYGLPREFVSSMYNFDDDYADLFGNPKSWCPAYFVDYKQLERPQSILLSSLYALKIYFRTEIQELKVERLAMEAQFFRQLRKYLFPPAILAFKHAIVGSMFWFEKSLLIDGLIQLLTRLCHPDKINQNELCDFIPLLFCWLLEKCDANEQTEDCFKEVKLTDTNKRACPYFQNPVTTSSNKRKALLLEEWNGNQRHSDIQYHVDIQSLTLYLTRTTNMSANSNGKLDSYVVYDPNTQDPSVLESLVHWTEFDIKELFKTIARTPEYRSFSIITRDSVNADVKNQLVLLDENRTVALLFSRKNNTRSNEKTPPDVGHFFYIFDPFRCTKKEPFRKVRSNDFQKDSYDPRLPIYLKEGLDAAKIIIGSLLDNGATNAAHQVTIILLDHSRSMLDYRVVSTNKVKNPTHADICKMMLCRLSDNVLSNNEIHAFGLIAFATSYRTVCPITRSREQFEKALTYDTGIGEWTCMYDAIGEAIRQIKTFVHSPIRAVKDCKKLIICLSDGINNYGSTTIDNLRELVKKHDIKIDFISFVRDEQLKNGKEVAKAQEFRNLCTDSGGYIYQNLRVLSDIELASIFEQEAAIWLSKRSKNSYGFVDKPERYISPMFEKKAQHQLPSNINVRNASSSRRILEEFRAMIKNPSKDVIIFAVPNNISFWKVILQGPTNTPYQEKFWMLYVEFDSYYPSCAPDVRFITPIYHVNISGDGKICHPIFSRRWSQQTKMQVVFDNIVDLLKEPNFEDAMSLEKAYLYNENPGDYSKQAEEHARKYAASDIKSLKREYELED